MTRISYAEAVAIQQELAARILLTPLAAPLETIAGADVSLERFGTELFAGIVVCSYPGLAVLEQATVRLPVSFPYIPGLLSFREIPGLLQCYANLRIRPGLIIVDGQGIAHPRRTGIAMHLGIELDVPTIGCAKSRLYGSYDEPVSAGEHTRVLDPDNGELLGYALKSKERSNPLIISPGHLITADESLAVIRECLRGYRLPEPTRLAHLLVNEFRRSLKK